MSIIFRRRKKIKTFAAFLILAHLLNMSAFAQMSPVVAPSEPGSPSDVGSIKETEKPKRDLPTGLLELTGFKDPVFLYVPEGLEKDKKYPLLFMTPGESATAESSLEYILPTAKSLECFVLATGSLLPRQGIPFELDRWLLKIKNDLMQRFPIDPSKIYAIGRNSGGHYAAYLITAYPGDFSGAALVGEAWSGLFEDVLKPRVSAGDQMPVVVAFATDQQDTKIKNEKWVLEYQQKGYPVEVMVPPAGQDLNSPDFTVTLLEWLDKKSQAWKLIREEQNKTFKQRLKKGVKEFFEI